MTHESKDDRLYVRGSRAEEPSTLQFDEKAKRRPDRYGCLPIITGSGTGAFRLPQNLGSGQREEGHPIILGVRGRPQKCGKDHS
jgi:hypothetical protein